MQKNNVAIQMTVVIVLAVITLLGISTGLSLGMQPVSALAQGAISTPEVAFTPAPLSDFGFAPTELMALDQGDTFDLAISKTTDAVSVAAGTQVTYTLTITNHGPNPAQYFYLHDSAPSEFINVTYTFPTADTALSNGDANPQWLIIKPIPDDGTMVVTVTGILTSLRDVQVVNTAIVTPFVQTADPVSGNNTDTASVAVAGSNPLANVIFLPYISKFPTPTPLPIVEDYYEPFNDTAWFEFDNNGCRTDHSSGQYWVYLDRDSKDCLPPADNNDKKPERPYRTYGEFQVEGYHSEGSNKDLALGIFINGQGEDNYYLFRIWPNTDQCGTTSRFYDLRRRRNGNTTTLRSGCSTAIKTGMGLSSTNTVRIAHKTDLRLVVYVNGTEVASYLESSTEHLTGTATGVYVKGVGNDTLVKFDNFRAYRYQ